MGPRIRRNGRVELAVGDKLSVGILSLHNAGVPGSKALTVPWPVFRSKPFSALTPSEPEMVIPRADRSLEHTHRVLDFGSAKTPNVE
jgi:hypothetical protein